MILNTLVILPQAFNFRRVYQRKIIQRLDFAGCGLMPEVFKVGGC